MVTDRTSLYIKAFSSLRVEEKILFLLELCHQLTVVCRGYYESEDFRRHRSINELIHVIVGQCSGLMQPSTKFYPDDVFISILFEGANSPELLGELLPYFDAILSYDFGSPKVVMNSGRR